MGHYAGKETIRDEVHTLKEHAHSIQKLYPYDASPITLTCGNAAPWTQGTIVQIVPVDTINSDFDIHWLHIASISANANYEVILYSGLAAAEVEIGRCPAVRNAVQSQEGSTAMMTPLQPAGTRISASVASSSGNADTLNVKIHYHTY